MGAWISVVVETETHRDWEILWLSRPRLIETGKFCGCRDQDSSRLVILWLSRPRLIETGKFCGCRDRDWEFLWLSRPRPAESEQKLSRLRLHRESHWSLTQLPKTINKSSSIISHEYIVVSSCIWKQNIITKARVVQKWWKIKLALIFHYPATIGEATSSNFFFR